MKNYLKTYKHKVLSIFSSIKNILIRQSHEQKFTEKLNEFCLYQKQVRSNLVHDIRNPLLNIKLSLEVYKNLIKKLKNSYQCVPSDIISTFEKHYTMINRDIRQIDFYIEKTLELEKNPMEELNLNLSSVNIKKELQMLLHKFQSIYTDDERIFNFNCSLSEEIFQVDKEKLKRMVINLLSNSVKYTPKGSVDLNLDEDAFNLIISVKDTGYGIPKDKIDEILLRFKRAETPYQQSGNGIGLSIVNHIVKLHKGEIKIESEEEKGSCFTLKFPKSFLQKKV